MKTLAVASQKGGAGKTTLVIHLATLAVQRGKRVAVVDLDPQRSAADWARSRSAPEPVIAEGEPGALAGMLKDARSDGFDLVVVDTAPHADAAIATAARLANLTLVPCRPGILDLRAIGRTVDILAALKRPFAVVLNACPPSRGFGMEPSIVGEARGVLSVPVMRTTITQRAALSHALIDGRAVTEYAPDSPAAAEMAALFAEIEGMW